MTHEILELNGKTRALTHLEIEIVFRAMIRAAEEFGGDVPANAANDWRAGLEMLDVGLADVSLQPYFNGREGANRPQILIEKARSYLPTGNAAVAVADLNLLIGANITERNHFLDRHIVNGGFDIVADLASASG